MLTRHDFASQTWGHFEEEMRSRLQKLREENDTNLDPTKTAEIRGRISEVKQLLALRTRRSASTEAHPGDEPA